MVRLNLATNEGDKEGPFIDLGEAAQVIMAHSSSAPGKFHFAVRLKAPVIVKRFGGEVTILCSCPGFHNHRKCWHVSLLGEEAEAEEENSEEE